MTHATRTFWTLGVALALLAASRDAQAQVDQPASARQLPRGHRWWCYETQLPSAARGERCLRQRAACARAPDAESPVLCTQQPRAWCVTYTARDYSTGRPIEGWFCVQGERVCEAQRERLYSSVGRDPIVSSCTEMR